MSAPTRRISIKQLVSLITIASTSVFLGFPASALNNSNPGSLKESFNNRSANSTARSRQLLVQGTSGTGGMGGTGTGTGTGQNGTGGRTDTGTGTGQNGMGAGGMGTGGTGTGTGTGTGQNGTGAGSMGTGAGGTTPGTGRSNGQQDAFTQYMLDGYAATDQRDYPTALSNFRNALQLRPGNPYATQAISNVEGYIQQQGSTQQRTRQQPSQQQRTRQQPSPRGGTR
ncbi:MAG TPA: hypothetical protein V6D43_09560 [Candidatus Sericytochromatia bacterium]